MKKSELPNWIGKEIVVQAPNDRYHGVEYGIVHDLTAYRRRRSRSSQAEPSPKGTLYWVSRTGRDYDRHRSGLDAYVPLSHLQPELADDHQVRYHAAKAISEANDARLRRERVDATNAADFAVQGLGVGRVHNLTGTPYILLTIEEVQQLLKERV